MYCKKCGVKNEVEGNYCISCGEALRNTKESSIFTSRPVNKSSPFFFIGGAILFIFVLFVLREGTSLFIPKEEINQTIVTYENFEFKLPTTFKTNIKNNILYISLSSIEQDKMVGLQIYDSSLSEMTQKFQVLESYQGAFKNVQITEYKNQDFVTAEYEESNMKSIIAITPTTNGKVFWIQSVTDSYKTGYQAIEEIAEVISSATYIGEKEKANHSTPDQL